MEKDIAGEIGPAHDLPAVVQRHAFTFRAECAPQRSQVNHSAVWLASRRWFPKERVDRHRGGIGKPGNLATLIDERSSRIGTAESTYILHPVPFLPQIRTRLRPEAG